MLTTLRPRITGLFFYPCSFLAQYSWLEARDSRRNSVSKIRLVFALCPRWSVLLCVPQCLCYALMHYPEPAEWWKAFPIHMFFACWLKRPINWFSLGSKLGFQLGKEKEWLPPKLSPILILMIKRRSLSWKKTVSWVDCDANHSIMKSLSYLWNSTTTQSSHKNFVHLRAKRTKKGTVCLLCISKALSIIRLAHMMEARMQTMIVGLGGWTQLIPQAATSSSLAFFALVNPPINLDNLLDHSKGIMVAAWPEIIHPPPCFMLDRLY